MSFTDSGGSQFFMIFQAALRNINRFFFQFKNKYLNFVSITIEYKRHLIDDHVIFIIKTFGKF